MAITVFLSHSPGLLNRGPGAQPLWDMSLIPASSLQLVCSPTDWTSCAPSYIIVWRPPFSCGRHKSHSFNPSTVKVIFWYSLTGCTFYLHRCISYFDSPVRSEVNIQQNEQITKKKLFPFLLDFFFSSWGEYIYSVYFLILFYFIYFILFSCKSQQWHKQKSCHDVKFLPSHNMYI